jgi:hypothetical protein
MAAAAAAAGAAAGPARDKAAAAVWDEIALRGALSAARAISDHVARAGALGEISRHLPEPEREVVFREALAAARAISDEAARDSALGVLSYYLPEMLKDEWRSARLPEIQSKPEFFITRIIGNEYQPDLAILTLPTWPSPEAIQDIDKLREEVICSDDFEIDRDRIKLFHFGPDACFTALHEAIVDAGFREKLLWEPEHSKNYARGGHDKSCA